MADFIEQKREEVEHLDAGDIDFSSEPGLGAEGCHGGHVRVLWDQRKLVVLCRKVEGKH